MEIVQTGWSRGSLLRAWWGVAVAGLCLGCADSLSLNPFATARLGEGLSAEELESGLREALALCVERARLRTGRRGGFGADPSLRISVPESLGPAAGALRQAGMGWAVEALEGSMNRAAERTAARAGGAFESAIRDLPLGDARSVLRGAPDAGTRALRERSDPEFRLALAPLVSEAMQRTGVAGAYRDWSSRLGALDVTGPADPGLEAHVLEHTLDGLFAAVAREEVRIRRDPAARTTPTLQRLFGVR